VTNPVVSTSQWCASSSTRVFSRLYNDAAAIVGMLSVNGYTGQIFLHTWHGNFIEESEE
jgi:hypothetical protein